MTRKRTPPPPVPEFLRSYVGRGVEHLRADDLDLEYLADLGYEQKEDELRQSARKGQKAAAATKTANSDDVLLAFERFCSERPHLKGERCYQEFLEDHSRDEWMSAGEAERRRMTEALRSRLRRARARRPQARRKARR